MGSVRVETERVFRRHSCSWFAGCGESRTEARARSVRWRNGRLASVCCRRRAKRSVRPVTPPEEPPRGSGLGRELRAGLATDPVQSAGPIQSAGRPSKVRRVFFASMPPTYWPIEPSLRTTRWQGTTTGIGLVAHAVPTARTAFGLPTATAMAA